MDPFHWARDRCHPFAVHNNELQSYHSSQYSGQGFLRVVPVGTNRLNSRLRLLLACPSLPFTQISQHEHDKNQLERLPIRVELGRMPIDETFDGATRSHRPTPAKMLFQAVR